MKKIWKIIFKILATLAAIALLILIILFMLVVILPALTSLFFKSEVDHIGYMMSRLNFDISKCEIKYSFDDYAGSFNGDGDYVLIADCSNKEDTIEYFEAWNKLPVSSKINDWKELPMPEDLHQEIYSTLDATEEYQIPVVENGYYYFIDRTPDAVDKSKYNGFGNTRNFTIAIFDTNSKMFYYYDYDS